jgi:hypothetical protein
VRLLVVSIDDVVSDVVSLMQFPERGQIVRANDNPEVMSRVCAREWYS